MLHRTFMPLACTVLLTLGSLALGCQAQEAAVSGSGIEDSLVVARIGGESITAAEVDQRIKDDLFDRQTAGGNPAKIYDLRSTALDEMVMERVLEKAAAERSISVEDLIRDEIAKRGEVTDEEVDSFYAEMGDRMGGRNLEEVSDRIREHLRDLRAQDAADELLAASAEILLERPRVQVDAEGPSKGPADATVTIVEFSDFQCPFCSRVLPALEELMERYPQDVRIVYRHMPLDRIHSRARPAAEASLCAEDQGKFWAYHDLLFANARTLGDADLKRFAQEADLDVDAFEQCVSDRTFQAAVEKDVQAARAIGVTGTPAFVVNGVVLSGAMPVEKFVPIIDEAIARAKASNSS
jgi:predicted DsbA family dithiol-disulfide isomerase